MKKYIYLILMLPLLLVSACYEGTDMGELFDSLYKETEIEITQSESNSQFSAVIEFSLEAAKYDSEIKIYYTSRRLVDPYPNGTVIDVAKITRQNMDETKSYTVKLDSLDPDTEYRYVIVSSDPSGHTTISKESSFTTEYMQLDADFYASSIYKLGVSLSFYNLPQDREIGYVFGSDSTVTINHCLKNISLRQSGESLYTHDILTELTPATTYYVRAYTITEGRVYYGKAAKGRTLDLDVSFNNFSVYLTTLNEARFECHVLTMQESYWYPEFYTNNEFNYGFQYSKSADLENAKECHMAQDYYMNCAITDLEPGTSYYLRVFAEHDGERIYSQTKQFKTRVDQLSGKVDSLYINGQFVYFTLVKAGTFMMGATSEQAAYAREDEYPAHEVTISEDFYISLTEIPNNNSGYPYRTSRAKAMEYVNHLQSSLSSLQVSLPTEAEWEYAARSGHLHPKQTLYSGSNTLQEVAWVYDPSYLWRPTNLPHVNHVKQKGPNALGIYDMSGNAAEWTLDAYQSDYYLTSPSTDPCCTTSDTKQSYVVRGGGTYTYDKYYSDTDYRVAARNYADNDSELFTFRLVIRNTRNK